jgi:hypothetical protein
MTTLADWPPAIEVRTTQGGVVRWLQQLEGGVIAAIAAAVGGAWSWLRFRRRDAADVRARDAGTRATDTESAVKLVDAASDFASDVLARMKDLDDRAERQDARIGRLNATVTYLGDRVTWLAARRLEDRGWMVRHADRLTALGGLVDPFPAEPPMPDAPEHHDHHHPND